MPKKTSQKERETLLALLKQIRSEAGLRQIDLAKKLGQPQPFVSRYESGERRLEILEFRRVCRILAITPAEFFERLDEMLNEA